MRNSRLRRRRQRAVEELPGILREQQAEVNRKVLPRFDRMLEAVNILKGLLIERRRILYGGFAIHLALIAKSKDLGVYTENDFPDMDAYTPDPMGDIEELFKRLGKAGFAHVRAEQAFHGTTYKVKCERYQCEVADFTYCWSHNFHRIPYLTTREGLRYVAPHFQIIDTYKTFVDPILSWNKIEKNLWRATLLEEQYLYRGFASARKRFGPLELTPRAQKHRDAVIEALQGRTDAVVVGSLAYNAMIEYSGVGQAAARLVDVGDVCVYGRDPELLLTEIVKGLRVRAYTIRNYRPLLEFYSCKRELVVDGRCILTVFGDPDLCLPFQRHAGLQLGSFHLVLRLLYIARWTARLEGDTEGIRRALYMLDNLQFARESYLARKHRSGTEPGLLQELQVACLGEQFTSPWTRYVERRVQRKHLVLEAGRAIPQIRFPNTSGRFFSERLPSGETRTVRDETGDGDVKAAAADAEGEPGVRESG